MTPVPPITDPDRIRNYLGDESGSFHGCAEALYLPADEDQLAEVLADLNLRRMPVVFSGGGTSITGSRVPMYGGAVVSFERMTSPFSRDPQGSALAASEGAWERLTRGPFAVLLDRKRRRAVLPPAIPLSDLDAILEPQGLLYPPDPTETAATVGGTVATNAAGGRCFHYGPTRAWVRRLRLVFADGSRADLARRKHFAGGRTLEFPTETGRKTVPLPDPADYPMPACKNAAGLFLAPRMDALDLFIGSEGILAAVSEIEVSLVPRPADTLTVIAYFPATPDLLNFVASVQEKKAWSKASRKMGSGTATIKVPDPIFLSLEYLDFRALEWIRAEYPAIPTGSAGAVLFEIPYTMAADEGPYPPADVAGELRDLLRRHHSTADWCAPTDRREALRLFRHAVPEKVNAYARAHQGKLGTDLAVPAARFREFFALHERLAAASGVRFMMWGHVGDCHLHLNFLADDEAEAQRARAAYVALARAAVAMGGTISAEHGVGKKRFEVEPGRVVPYLELLYGDRGLRAVAQVKRALDPNWILNAGNMVPPELGADVGTEPKKGSGTLPPRSPTPFSAGNEVPPTAVGGR